MCVMFLRIIHVAIVILLVQVSCFAQKDNKTDKTLNKNVSYFELAVLGGIPATPSLSGAFWYKSVGIRFSGGYYDYEVNGFQLNISYKTIDNYKTGHSVGIAYGKSQDRGCEYSYFGSTYDYTYKHLFVELGICKVFDVERGDFSDLPYWIILQVGYVYRFVTKNDH